MMGRAARVGQEDKEEKEKMKKKKRDCHVGPTCKKKSRGSIVGTLAGVRRKKQAPKNRRSPYS
jgi:hypothetical protein